VDVAFDETVRARSRGATGISAGSGGRPSARGLDVTAGRRRGPHRVLFASRLISEMSGNLKVVHDRMVERGTRPRPDLEVMLKPGLTERWRFLDRFAWRARSAMPT
jgi:hypothetical protein